MTTRHEFLAQLHDLIKPRLYLEIGVQRGTSLALAAPDCAAIGIDVVGARELDRPPRPNEAFFEGTSADFFQRYPQPRQIHPGLDWPSSPLDLAFIDGSHLAEDAALDFINIERWGHPGTVVVFDDVLPRNQTEASRIQCPGDWTGDVWRVHRLLVAQRPDLRITLVNTTPTGTMVVCGLNPDAYPGTDVQDLVRRVLPPEQVQVPDFYLHRFGAFHPDVALRTVKDHLFRLTGQHHKLPEAGAL